MLTSQEHLLWHTLHRLSNEITRYERKVFANAGITREQYRILLMTALRNNITKKPIKLTDLVPIQGCTLVSISLIIDRMESKGLVKKVKDKVDKRIIWINITPKGEKFLFSASKPTIDLVKKLFSHLSPEEIDNTTITLRRLMQIFPSRSETDSVVEVVADYLNKLGGY